jgi:hypothetical protein
VNDAVTPANIFNLGLGFWASKTLLSAVELGLFTELAKGPAYLGDLSRRLGLHDRSVRDFLDALVALNMLDRQDGRYNNTAETDLFLDRAKPSDVGGFLEMANARLYESWGSLTEALKTGRNQNEAKESGDVFAALYADPDRLRGFLAAMSGASIGAAQAIAAKFPWQDYQSFVDIGTAQGMVPVTIARAHNHLSGAGYDLPEVKPVFEEFIAQHGTPCRQPMSSSWATFCTTGIWRRNACCWKRRMPRFPPAGRLSFMRRSSMTSGAKMSSACYLA